MKHSGTRREFLKFAGLSGGAFALSGCAGNLLESSRAKRPNILWISCEDISGHLGCYGEEFAITPNIDQFAEEGVRYTRAFTVHGVCAPSRSGIITGMYPSSLGSCHMRYNALRPESIRCFPEYLRQVGYYCTNNVKTDYNFKTPKQAWDQCNGRAHWKNRPEDKPFFAVFNFERTHESQLWNSADFDNTHPKRLTESEWQKPEKMKIPPIYPDTPAVRRDLARLFERITEFDYFVKDRLDEVKKAGLYDDTIVFVWSDHGNGLPRAKRWLYDSGTLVPLIVRIPERYRVNGQGQAGSVDGRLVNFIDLGPTVLNLAGVGVGKHMQGQAFLGPKLPGKRKYIFGARDRIDEIYDMVRSVRDGRYRYIRNFNPFRPYFPYLYYAEKCNTMREMRRLYAEGKLNDVQAQWMVERRPSEELYDLENDPWEVNNLAGDAEYTGMKKQLEKALNNWMIETRDTGLLPESLMKRLAKEHGSEYAILHREGGERRARKLLKIATIATEPKHSDRRTIYKAFESNDAAQRYWAVIATGQLKQSDDIWRLKTALNDEEGSIRVAAARSLYWAGHKETGLESLERELKKFNEQEEVLHFTLDVLKNLGDDAKAVIETVRQLNEARTRTDYMNRTAKDLIEKFNIR
jgi:arylsulfatase A-like enzyme